MEHGHAREKAGGDRLLRAERWLALVHKAAMTALALVSLWLILR